MKKGYLIKRFFLGLLVLIPVLIYQGYYQDITVENLKKSYANKHSKFIEIDGMQVHYKDEGNGFPIVLLHGTAASLHTWDDWTTELSKKYRVIRLDLPGFGITGPNKNADYSIESYVKFLHQFLSKINVNEYYLAGNSLGGNIAWNYAAEHSEKVTKLILIDASGLPTNKEQPFVFKMAKTPILSSLFLYITPKYFIEKNMKEVYEDDSKISDELIDRYHKMVLREGNRQAFIDRAKTDFTPNEFKNSEKLKTILTPTLLIWGAKDTWIPLDNGKRMNNLLPNATLYVIKNSGHVPMEENPKESLFILNEFLANSR